jgi:hypothetical protein
MMLCPTCSRDCHPNAFKLPNGDYDTNCLTCRTEASWTALTQAVAEVQAEHVAVPVAARAWSNGGSMTCAAHSRKDCQKEGCKR